MILINKYAYTISLTMNKIPDFLKKQNKNKN